MGAQNHDPIGRHIPVKVFWGIPPPPPPRRRIHHRHPALNAVHVCSGPSALKSCHHPLRYW